MTALMDLARVLRSKNSGPFEVTFDIFLGSREDYLRVWNSGVLSAENIARLYRIPVDRVRTVACMEAAYGIKITLLRQIPSGTEGDRDVYGAQQAAPLMGLMIP